MIEFFSILLVVIVMCLFLLVLFFWSGQNSAYSVFLFVLLLWMLFLVFNVSRANLDSVVSVNSSVKIYNSTGSLNNEENASVVNFVSPVKSTKAKINFEGVTAGITAHFVDNNFFRLAGLDKLLVSEETNDKKENNHKNTEIFTDNQSIIVSQAVLNLLSIPDKAIGNLLDLKVSGDQGAVVLESTYKIIEIINDDLNSFVYLSLSAYPSDQLLFYNNLKVQVKSTVFLEEVRDQIVGYGFAVSALSDTVRQANKVFKVIKSFLSGNIIKHD